MDKRYSRIVNALLTTETISELVNKTGVEYKKVEHLSIEVLARILGDGSDLNKANIEHRIKTIVKSDDLKALLRRLSEKYEISLKDASLVLAESLPILFRKVNALDESYFKEEETTIAKQAPQEVKVEEPRHQVQYAVQEEIKPLEQDTSVDEVFTNIEKKATQENEKREIEIKDKSTKKKKRLVFDKEKNRMVLIKNVAEGNIDNKELNIIEKVCMFVVLVALLSLVGTIIFLFIKQKI